MKKRILSLVVCAALVLGMVPVIGQEAHAAGDITAEEIEAYTDAIPADVVNGNTDVKTTYYVYVNDLARQVNYCTGTGYAHDTGWYYGLSCREYTHGLTSNHYTPMTGANDTENENHTYFYATEAAANAQSKTFADISGGGTDGGGSGDGTDGGGSGGGTDSGDTDETGTGKAATEGLTTSKTLTRNSDGTYTVTVEAYVTGTVDSRYQGVVYAEELDTSKTYYTLNEAGLSRTMSYCSTCGKWYISAGTNLSGLYSYILTAYKNCETNHTYIPTDLSAADGILIGKFTPVGKYSNTSEQASTDVQPLVLYFFSSSSYASAAISVSGSSSRGYTRTYKGTKVITTAADLEGLGTDTILKDTVSSYFHYVDGSASISVQTYSSSGWTVSSTATPTVSGSAITWSGLDYSANPVITDSGYEQGSKVVLTYEVTADSLTEVGGVFPVGTGRAGIYQSGADQIATFNNPTISVAAEDDSDVELKELDGLVLDKNVIDNQDNTYTVVLAAYATGHTTAAEGVVYADDLDTSTTYWVYNSMEHMAAEMTYCSRCGEWWFTTWHLFHTDGYSQNNQLDPRTGADDMESTHVQFYETAAAALAAQGGDTVVVSDCELDGTAVLNDYISRYFHLANGESSVTAYTSYYTGSAFSGTGSDSGLSVTVDEDSGSISVSGFDFGGNCVAEGIAGGYRLVVAITLSPKEGVEGTVATNTAYSGIYDGGSVAAHFPRPSVNVVTYVVDGSGSASTEDEEIDLSGLELSKVLTDNGDGTYGIDLEAFTTGSVTTSTGTPLDVIFVLHRSSTAAGTTITGQWTGRWWKRTFSTTTSSGANMLNVAKTGIEEMVMTLQNDGTADSNGVGHRVALVTFSGTDKTATVSGLTDVNSDSFDLCYGDGSTGLLWNSDDAQATTANTYTANSIGSIVTGYTLTDNGDGSRIDWGLAEAQSILASDTVSGSSERQTIVVVLMAGIPGDGFGNTTWGGGNAVTVANAALAEAQTLKDAGALIYTVGLYSSGTVTDDESVEVWQYVNEDTMYDGFNEATTSDHINTRRFMHMLSSNLTAGPTDIQGDFSAYKNAVYDWSAGYFKAGSTAETAANAFDLIQSSTIAPLVDVSGVAALRDQVTRYFDILTSTVKVYTADCTAIAEDGDGNAVYTFAAPVEAEGVAVATDNGMVSVTGFDYSANNVQLDDSGNVSGQKLIVSFDVKPKDGFVGGNNVPTNVASASGLYINQTADDEGNVILDTVPSATFGESPQANVSLTLPSVGTQDHTIKYGDAADGLALYYEIDTLTDSWKYDFVAVSYNSANSIDNTKCGGYEVSVAFTPNSDGAGAVGTVAKTASSAATATVHVLTPNISVQNTSSMIYLGNSVILGDLVKVSGWSCAHGETLSGDSSGVVLTYSAGGSTLTGDAFEPTEHTTITVTAAVSGTVMSANDISVYVVKPKISANDAAIYLSQAANLTELGYVEWYCENYEEAISEEEIIEILGAAPTVDLTYTAAGTAVPNATAYAPTDCTTVTVSGGSYEGIELSGSVTVHVLRPGFTVTTKDIWADYGVEVALAAWGIDRADPVWTDECDGAEDAPEAEGDAPELTVTGYTFRNGSDGVYTTTETDVTVDVAEVKYTLNGSNETFALTDKSFDIRTNKFDLVVSKAYAKSYAAVYAQTPIFRLTDTAANKYIRFVGEEDGSTKVVGLICGKNYTVSEETDWAWRYTYVATSNGAVSCTNSSAISNTAPEIQTVTVTFTNTLTTLQWMSYMVSSGPNLFE